MLSLSWYILPYALQLLCLVHAIKTGRNSTWIWIIIIVPYIGGLAYLGVEILPSLLSRRRAHAVQDGILAIVRPREKTKTLRLKAEFSATHNNLLDYADALLSDRDYAQALEIYRRLNQGIFKDDPELLYKLALAEHSGGKPVAARAYLDKLMDPEARTFRSIREYLLYLQVLEKTEATEAVDAEYLRILELKRDMDIDLQHLDYLGRTGRAEEARARIEKLRKEEEVMRRGHLRYNKDYYRAAYRIGRNLDRKA